MKKVILTILLAACVVEGDGQNVSSSTRESIFKPKIIISENVKNLIEAAEHGDIEKIKEYLQKTPDNLNKHIHGHTALRRAVLYGQNEVVIYLVEQGAPTQIEEKDENGNFYTENILNIAGKLNPKAMKKILENTIKKKVDEISFGIILGSVMIVEEHKEEERIEILQLLYDWSQGTKLSLNVPRWNGATVLILAVNFKRYKSLEFLLNILTINVNAQEKRGNTALHKAILESDEKAVRLLLTRNDLDLNLKNRQNKTVLDLAKGEIKKMLEDYKNK